MSSLPKRYSEFGWMLLVAPRAVFRRGVIVYCVLAFFTLLGSAAFLSRSLGDPTALGWAFQVLPSELAKLALSWLVVPTLTATVLLRVGTNVYVARQLYYSFRRDDIEVDPAPVRPTFMTSLRAFVVAYIVYGLALCLTWFGLYTIWRVYGLDLSFVLLLVAALAGPAVQGAIAVVVILATWPTNVANHRAAFRAVRRGFGPWIVYGLYMVQVGFLWIVGLLVPYIAIAAFGNYVAAAIAVSIGTVVPLMFARGAVFVVLVRAVGAEQPAVSDLFPFSKAGPPVT